MNIEQSLEWISSKVQDRVSGILGEHSYTKVAVMVPIVMTREQRLGVLFEKRAQTFSRPGEICFPGGHAHAEDQTQWITALRETCEELQIPRETVTYLGSLDTMITHTRMMVYSYVGFISAPDLIHPNEKEVEEVFVLDLEQILNATPERHEVSVRVDPGENFPFHLIPNGRNYPWRGGTFTELFYRLEGRVIWGLTARILSHFVEVVRA